MDNGAKVGAQERNPGVNLPPSNRKDARKQAALARRKKVKRKNRKGKK